MANASTCTDECKRECAGYAISPGRPATQVAKELGVHYKTLRHWVKKRRDQIEGKAGSKAEPADAEALQKRIREPGQENKFLKKASASFAANQAR